MKIATTTGNCVAKFGLEEGIRILCDAGYDCLDLSLGMLAKDPTTPYLGEDYRDYAKHVRALANDRGVTFNQSHAPFHFKWAEPGVIENVAKPTIIRAMEISSIVGAHSIIIHPIHHTEYKGHEQEMHELNIEYYKSYIPYCEKFGIRIAVENMWQPDVKRKCPSDDVCSRAETLIAMLDELRAVAPDCFTACLDVGHVGLVGEEAQDSIRALGGDRLGCLHVHDNNYQGDQHLLPGQGQMNWPAITAALKEIGYKGEFTYEADGFLKHFTPDIQPRAVKFMADIARHWASQCE
ncbi:MAG: sugar phosphate isomerase/epimerase [Clostridia bacterium]|nr:sugar phosphate isomerase/epimerase [Clostridia bacterium]